MASRRALIIDDDSDFRASLKPLLESHGFEVIEAESGQRGLQKVVQEHPDLIILDLILESSSVGFGVNQALKFQREYRQFRNVPVIMVSAIPLSPIQLFKMARETGRICPDCYLTKPLDVSRFLRLLERFREPRRTASL